MVFSGNLNRFVVYALSQITLFLVLRIAHMPSVICKMLSSGHSIIPKMFKGVKTRADFTLGCPDKGYCGIVHSLRSVRALALYAPSYT